MSIKSNLHHVIQSMTDFSSKTNMVAINASIRASKLSPAEGAPFRVLASEIQDMSIQSKDKLSEINSLIDEIAELSRLINKTGAQRMIIMKIINAHLMKEEEKVQFELKSFSDNLTEIEKSSINSVKIHQSIDSLNKELLVFCDLVNEESNKNLFSQGDKMINLINNIISEYEIYAGD